MSIENGKQLDILFKDQARSFFNFTKLKKVDCYFLFADSQFKIDLLNSYQKKIVNRNVPFNKVFQQIKSPFLEVMSEVNQKFNSPSWWGSPLASKTTTSTPLVRQLIYFFSIQGSLKYFSGRTIIILESSALASLIYKEASKIGFDAKIHNYKNFYFRKYLTLLLRLLKRIAYFIFLVFMHEIFSYKKYKRNEDPLYNNKKHFIVRSWVTNDTFNNEDIFEDRNFGPLLGYLHSQGVQVQILPMIFNIKIGFSNIYKKLKSQNIDFILPQNHLKLIDYVTALYNSLKILRHKVCNIKIKRYDISPIINESIKHYSFDPGLVFLNLSFLTLYRLSRKKVTIDSIFYAFECNPPEKQFLLGCKNFFPNTKTIGYQHTAFYSNQLACVIDAKEKYFHPFPDKIICSGEIYLKLLYEAGFPKNILELGPNLRFNYIHKFTIQKSKVNDSKINILVPLTFSLELAYEILKISSRLLAKNQNYNLFIRNHPLLPQSKIDGYMNQFNVSEYHFLNEGSFQDALNKCDFVISNGGSITILEAVIYGTPILRVIPKNEFYLDPLYCKEYPFKPVSDFDELQNQVKTLTENFDRKEFLELSATVKKKYFNKINKKNLELFL